MSEIAQQPYIFELVGNRLCLDFVNTVDGRKTGKVVDRLATYSDLVYWGLQAEAISEEEAQQLLERAALQPEEAQQALRRVVEVRDALYRLFSALAYEQEPQAADMQIVNRALSDAMCHVSLELHGDHFDLGWAGAEHSLNRILWAVIRSTSDLLTSEEMQLIRMCAADDCAWLFLDTSKNHSRRWCDMKNCGNRVKVGRHYERKKQKQD